MFRSAFKRNRCIVPASGYFEWQTMPDGKQPYFISAADGNVLSIADLWDPWHSTDTGETVLSCTMIVSLPEKAGVATSSPCGGNRCTCAWACWSGGDGSTAGPRGDGEADFELRPVRRRRLLHIAIREREVGMHDLDHVPTWLAGGRQV
jgi:hypothetical protein